MFRKLMKKTSEIYHRARCYIDDEAYLTAEERMASDSDKFASVIEELLTSAMRRERFSYQDGKVLIPTIYRVVLSEPDAAEWPGVKRSGLETRLRNHIYKGIRSIASESTFMSHGYDLTIGTGNDLEKGEVRIISQWENAADPVNVHIRSAGTVSTAGSFVRPGNRFFASNHGQTFFDDKADDETIVRSTPAGSFLLEIWRGGFYQGTVPVKEGEISAGRGSYSRPVDVLLTGDPEISRVHLILRKTETDDFRITVKGKNPVAVRGKAFELDDTALVTYDDFINIGTYALRLRKKCLANEYITDFENTHQIIENIS